MNSRKIMANNISYYMKRTGISRKELCKALNFKYTTVCDWLNGKRYPRIEKIEAMAEYFGIDKSELIEDHTQTEPEPKQSEFNTVLQFILSKHPDIGDHKFTDKQLDSIITYATLLKEA